MASAKALVFAGVEDFGITLVEAQAAGVPVIAYRRGGATETVRDITGPHPTGVLVDERTPEAFMAAVERLDSEDLLISANCCRRNAMLFAEERFRREFKQIVDQAIGKAPSGERLPPSELARRTVQPG